MLRLHWLRGLKMPEPKQILLPGSILQEKAKEYPVGLGIDDIQCSDGCLHGFRCCYDIQFCVMIVISGESGDVTTGQTDQCTTITLPQLLQEYHPNDIFNADGSGLYYKLLPNKSLVLIGDLCCVDKRSKERLTILPLCAIQNIASKHGFNSKNQCLVTDFFM